MNRAARWLREGVLWAGAVLGVLSLVVAALAVTGAVRPLVFTSGSMAPAIPEGSLAFSRPVDARSLAVGDVVNVARGDGQQVTHRVEAIERDADGAVLTLKGDANAVADSETYSVQEAHRVLLDVPWLGYVARAFENPLLGLTFVGFLGWLILSPLFLQRRRRPSGRRSGTVRGRRERSGQAAVVVAAVTLASVSVGQSATPTLAGFMDTATVTSGNVEAHTVISQAQPGCQTVGIVLLGDVARMTWTKTDSRYAYEVQLRGPLPATTPVDTQVVGGSQAAGQTVTVDIDTELFGGDNGNYDVVVTAHLQNTTSWRASASTTTPVRRAPISNMRCGHS